MGVGSYRSRFGHGWFWKLLWGMMQLLSMAHVSAGRDNMRSQKMNFETNCNVCYNLDRKMYRKGPIELVRLWYVCSIYVNEAEKPVKVGA
jgi:hypothetical protein